MRRRGSFPFAWNSDPWEWAEFPEGEPCPLCGGSVKRLTGPAVFRTFDTQTRLACASHPQCPFAIRVPHRDRMIASTALRTMH